MSSYISPEFKYMIFHDVLTWITIMTTNWNKLNKFINLILTFRGCVSLEQAVLDNIARINV